LANLKLRDRDGILTNEGLVFRILGYSHPPNAYICDAEYANAKIFQSHDPRAPRTGANQTFFKFYDDEGLKFVFKNYPKYIIHHEMLDVDVLGINEPEVKEARKPEERLQELIKDAPQDELEDAMQRVLATIMEISGTSTKDFGVFGSMLHGFHHPKYSDIDLLVYGKKENSQVRLALSDLYKDASAGFSNEFKANDAMKGKRWRFKNFTVDEFVWHQKRKLIYGLYEDKLSGRTIKAEFEPVKKWQEIGSEYDPQTKIKPKGWVRITAKVTDDSDGPFIPSIYGIKPTEVNSGPAEAAKATRVISYMEEFRAQVLNDEKIQVEGTLEEVAGPKGSFYQITLTYCPRYYEQFLKTKH
jgi:predicted nucleotidyltransferase